MFIEDLWEKFPEQTINAIKKIFEIREERGDKLVFLGKKNGSLVFEKYGHCPDSITLSDFDVAGRSDDSVYKLKWIKFMYSVYGDKYAMQYISNRNKALDKFMADYEQKYNAQTRDVLVKMGFEKAKDQSK